MTSYNVYDDEAAHEAFTCVDPEVGSALLYGYVAHTLTEEDRQAFEDHLCLCLKCEEELEWLRDLLHTLKTDLPLSLQDTLRGLVQQGVVQAEDSEFFFRVYTHLPLPVSGIEDLNRTNLMPEYQGAPLVERLAASTEVSEGPAFPLTVSYLDGAVIGQFRRRAGQLFFRLHSETFAQQPVACLLQYPSPEEAGRFDSLMIRVGEEKRLGAFRAFAPSNTMQEMLTTLKHFELRLVQTTKTQRTQRTLN